MSSSVAWVRRHAPGLSLLGLLALTWLVYWPGRTGAFLFDDYSNLAPLADYGPIHQMWKAVAFITSGFAGPTGRPLALASFLLDARDWPASPLAFKLTNVALHLLCGALLAGLLTTLSRGLGAQPRRAAWIGVLAAGLWMLDPFWVSTTLYVVQRMAMLSALFTFAALWGYARGRELLLQGRLRRGYALASLSIGLGTVAATLSKENGALLPMLAWVLEALVLEPAGTGREVPGFVAWRRLFLALPSLVLAAYLLSYLPAVWTGATGGRAFTPGQRLLTESRVMWEYLRDIWQGRVHDGGLFHDDQILSTGWLHPWTTLPAVLGLLGLGVAAWRACASRRPALVTAGAALLFFYTGHLVESTWIQLELVFEHRNYLPAALMFWPVAWLVVPRRRPVVPRPLCRPSRRWLGIAVLSWLALFSVQTERRATAWGAPFQQALSWAREHPHSARAQSYLANFWSRVGNDAEAARLLDAALSRHPDDLVLLVNRAGVACRQGDAAPGLRAALLRATAAAPLGNHVVQYQVDRLVDGLSGCRAFGPDFVADLLVAGLRSPQAGLPSVRRDLLHAQSSRALAHGDARTAYELDLQALRLPGLPPGMRLRLAAELGSAGHPRLALRLLDAVPASRDRIHGWNMAALHQRWLNHVGFLRQSEAHLRDVLQRQVARVDTPDRASTKHISGASRAAAPAKGEDRPWTARPKP